MESSQWNYRGREAIAKLSRAIVEKYPFVRIHTTAFDVEEYLSINTFIWLLNIPSDKIVAVEDYAHDVACKLYGDDPIPFCISAVSEHNTKKYFGEIYETDVSGY